MRKNKALDACGRLKKGYKFKKGGAIVKAKAKPKAKAKAKPKAKRKRVRKRVKKT